MSHSESLDPDDWESFRNTAHQAVDIMIDQLRNVGNRPVWQPLPLEVKQRIQSMELPRAGIGEQATLETFCRDVLPYPNGSWHPRFFGWVQGTGIPFAMIADMLASGMNAHLAGFDIAPKYVELQVIRWIAEMVGWPSESGGLLTSGGSMANTLALAVARHSQANWDIRRDGMQSETAGHLTIYCSNQTHGWIDKAVELLGMGRRCLRKISSDQQGRIDIHALRVAIVDDRRTGKTPICVCGNAGTVHFGATDDLRQIAEVCQDEGLWFHVDGAFGALAYLLEEFRPQLASMDRADSLAVDLHKWMYLPFDIGVVLIRDQQLQLDTFAASQSYMQSTDRGLLAGGVPFADRGIELTRSFRALNAWMCFQAYGIDRFANCIRANIEQARYLAELVENNELLELVAPVPMNIVCFRYIGNRKTAEDLNLMNQEILLRLQESGEAVLSSTTIGNTLALRAAITNHRTQKCDMDRMLDAILKIAKDVAN